MWGAIVAAVSCSKFEPAAPADGELLDGPVEGLTNAQLAEFLAGDVAFNDQIFTRETGLWPIFVSTSCGSTMSVIVRDIHLARSKVLASMIAEEKTNLKRDRNCKTFCRQVFSFAVAG